MLRGCGASWATARPAIPAGGATPFRLETIPTRARAEAVTSTLVPTARGTTLAAAAPIPVAVVPILAALPVRPAPQRLRTVAL